MIKPLEPVEPRTRLDSAAARVIRLESAVNMLTESQNQIIEVLAKAFPRGPSFDSSQKYKFSEPLESLLNQEKNPNDGP